MDKLDLVKTDKNYFSAKTTPAIVEIGEVTFISITGQGDPSGKLFAEKIQALYTAAYALKFSQKELGRDFVVSKLEGLWWYDEALYRDVPVANAPTRIPRSEWFFRLLIRIPKHISEQDIQNAVDAVAAKKQVTYLGEVHHFSMHEGTCVQILHLGPFDKEPETLAVLQDFIMKQNLGRNGLHHEIYLSDFRRTAPEKLKTILREPVTLPGDGRGR